MSLTRHNPVLACIIDITTALIPEFLLYKVQMKRRTRVILNTVFGLGLITAGLSIGRVAVSNSGVWETDSTCKIIPETPDPVYHPLKPCLTPHLHIQGE